MVQQIAKKQIDYSGCAWALNDGSGGFNKASRPGFALMSTAHKMLLMGAVNATYAERHPGEPQLITGFEMHVPNEVTLYKKSHAKLGRSAGEYSGLVLNSIEDVEAASEKTGIVTAMVTPNNHHYSIFRAATSADPREREGAKQRLDETFKVAKRLGARTIVLWNGGEVYSSPMEPNFPDMINNYIQTLKYAAQEAIKHDMYIAIEPKPFEPGDEMFPNNSMGVVSLILDANKRGLLSDEEVMRIGINDEMGHVVMAFCDLAQNYEMLRHMQRNYHAHINRQHKRGKHDTDNEIVMDMDTLAVISALKADPVFMSTEVRRFAGFDYHPRHQHTGQQALLTMYANGARARALEKVADQLATEDGALVKALRDEHRYVQLDSHTYQRIAEAAIEVEKEIFEVGKQGIVVPADLEERVNRLAA